MTTMTKNSLEVPPRTQLHLSLSSPARSGNDLRSVKSNCKRFFPNVFTPNKCQECFRSKSAHSADALAENRAARKICKFGYLFVAPTDYDYNNPAHKTRRWQQRWFVLYDDGELTFALDNNSDTLPQAIVDMHHVIDVQDATNLTGHESSLLLQTPDQDYFIKATSKEEIRWWYDVLVMYPRSQRYTKQQRNLHQRRSRTLPNNALSDQQLKALREFSDNCESQTSIPVPLTTVSTHLHVFSDYPPAAATTKATSLSPSNSALAKSDHAIADDAGPKQTPFTQPSSIRTAKTTTTTTTNRVRAGSRNNAGDDVKLNGNGENVEQHDGSITNFNLNAKKPAEKYEGLSGGSHTIDHSRANSLSGNTDLNDKSPTEYLHQLKEKRSFNQMAQGGNRSISANGNGKLSRNQTFDSTQLPRVKDEHLVHNQLKTGANIPTSSAGVVDNYRANTNADSFTDTDLSTDSEEGLAREIIQPPIRSAPPVESGRSNSSVSRFVFTGLSHRDVEDLKQLQRIMSKTSNSNPLNSTGSTSSRSSSCSSASASALSTAIKPKSTQIKSNFKPSETRSTASIPTSIALPVQIQVIPDLTNPDSKSRSSHRARSPPPPRNPLSKAKERSRVRSRSKSPVPSSSSTAPEMVGDPGRSDQRTLLINGVIRYEDDHSHSTTTGYSSGISECRPGSPPNGSVVGQIQLPVNAQKAEERLNRLRQEYLLDRSHNTSTGLSRNGLDESMHSSTSSFLQAPASSRRTTRTSDQSTQISLDVRHYETMVSNLEKRLLDREQLLRETTLRTEAMKKEQTTLAQEQNKYIQNLQDQLSQSRHDQDLLVKNLELSRTLCDKYERRLQYLVKEMNQLKEDDEDVAALRNNVKKLENERDVNEKVWKDRLGELEGQVAEMGASLNEMGLHKDSLLNSSRQEASALRKKLNETETLLRMALQRDLDDDEALCLSLTQSLPGDDGGIGSSPSWNSLPAGDDIQQIGKKFLRALKEIKALRKENVALNDQITEMNSEFADLKERLQTINMEAEAHNRLKDDETVHSECHKTIEALHSEISSLQLRLHNHERRHTAELSQRDEFLSDIMEQLKELTSEPSYSDRSSPNRNSAANQYESRLRDMQNIYENSLSAFKSAHAKSLEDERTAHKEEMRIFQLRKEQELADEAQATKAALEAIRKSYQENLAMERNRLNDVIYSGKANRHFENEDFCTAVEKNIDSLRQQLASELTLREQSDQLKIKHDRLIQVLDMYQKKFSSLNKSANSEANRSE